MRSLRTQFYTYIRKLRKSRKKHIRQYACNLSQKDLMHKSSNQAGVMGHAIKGSRQAYYDRNDIDQIRKCYEKCNFSREVPTSEISKLHKQLEDEQTKRVYQEVWLGKLEKELEATRNMLKEMLTKQQ